MHDDNGVLLTSSCWSSKAAAEEDEAAAEENEAAADEVAAGEENPEAESSSEIKKKKPIKLLKRARFKYSVTETRIYYCVQQHRVCNNNGQMRRNDVHLPNL